MKFKVTINIQTRCYATDGGDLVKIYEMQMLLLIQWCILPLIIALGFSSLQQGRNGECHLENVSPYYRIWVG